MTVMVQIRNMPDEMHRTFKSRAALAGLSLSDYLLRELRPAAERPSLEELRARIASWPDARLSMSAADMVRQERDRR